MIFCCKAMKYISILCRIEKRLITYEVPTRVRNEPVKYYLILDFEATCTNSGEMIQEIIEFPVLKVKAKTMLEESRFHAYVRPLINPTLTDYCVELTGILQEMVENAKDFPQTLDDFESWRESENLTEENSLYITSGNWDLGRMLPLQCDLLDISVPSHMTEWADLKRVYASTTGQFRNSLRALVKSSNLDFYGRQHSGIDDCINILNVSRELALKGANFKATSKWNSEKKKFVLYY